MHPMHNRMAAQKNHQWMPTLPPGPMGGLIPAMPGAHVKSKRMHGADGTIPQGYKLAIVPDLEARHAADPRGLAKRSIDAGTAGGKGKPRGKKAKGK